MVFPSIAITHRFTLTWKGRAYYVAIALILFDQDGHQDSSSPSSDFWLFPKLRGCCYETIEEMKEAVMKVIDTLTQEDFHGAFQKLLEQYNKCIAAGGDYFKGGLEFHVWTIGKSLETYLMILAYLYIYRIRTNW